MVKILKHIQNFTVSSIDFLKEALLTLMEIPQDIFITGEIWFTEYNSYFSWERFRWFKLINSYIGRTFTIYNCGAAFYKVKTCQFPYIEVTYLIEYNNSLYRGNKFMEFAEFTVNKEIITLNKKNVRTWCGKSY